jgi:hypothetical protein
VHYICWKITISKGASNILEAKTSSKNIFSRELGDVKGLDVILESIAHLLNSCNHAFDDTSKGSYGATPIFRNAVKI